MVAAFAAAYDLKSSTNKNGILITTSASRRFGFIAITVQGHRIGHHGCGCGTGSRRGGGFSRFRRFQNHHHKGTEGLDRKCYSPVIIIGALFCLVVAADVSGVHALSCFRITGQIIDCQSHSRALSVLQNNRVAFCIRQGNIIDLAADNRLVRNRRIHHSLLSFGQCCGFNGCSGAFRQLFSRDGNTGTSCSTIQRLIFFSLSCFNIFCETRFVCRIRHFFLFFGKRRFLSLLLFSLGRFHSRRSRRVRSGHHFRGSLRRGDSRRVRGRYHFRRGSGFLGGRPRLLRRVCRGSLVIVLQNDGVLASCFILRRIGFLTILTIGIAAFRRRRLLLHDLRFRRHISCALIHGEGLDRSQGSQHRKDQQYADHAACLEP